MSYVPTTVVFKSIGNMGGKYALKKECLMCGGTTVTYAAVVQDGFSDADGFICEQCVEDAKHFYRTVEHLEPRIELR
jgi:hypothetical protein